MKGVQYVVPQQFVVVVVVVVVVASKKHQYIREKLSTGNMYKYWF